LSGNPTNQASGLRGREFPPAGFVIWNNFWLARYALNSGAFMMPQRRSGQVVEPGTPLSGAPALQIDDDGRS